MAAGLCKPAVAEDPVVGGSEPGDRQRIARLQDALDNGGDWDIGMPLIAPGDDLESTIRSGNALRSNAYRALDREMRRIDAQLADDPSDSSALADRAALRQRLLARAESNMRLGYFYAANVYISMLEMAGGEPAEVRELRRRVGARRAFDRAAERFDAAIDDARIESPPGDNARFWLARMRELGPGDTERLRAAERQLLAARGTDAPPSWR